MRRRNPASLLGFALATVGLGIGLFLTVSPAVAGGDQATGIVIFRIELRGSVPPDAWFLVTRDTDPPRIIEPGIFVCGPPENVYTERGPLCTSAGSFETRIRQPVGTELEYRFYLGRGGSDTGIYEGDVLLEGTVTVGSSAQLRTLVHDFSGQSLLPDTAVPGNADAIDEIFHPIAERVLARCDACLRIGGESSGADGMVRAARGFGKVVFTSIRDVPSAHNL